MRVLKTVARVASVLLLLALLGAGLWAIYATTSSYPKLHNAPGAKPAADPTATSSAPTSFHLSAQPPIPPKNLTSVTIVRFGFDVDATKTTDFEHEYETEFSRGCIGEFSATKSLQCSLELSGRQKLFADQALTWAKKQSQQNHDAPIVADFFAFTSQRFYVLHLFSKADAGQGLNVTYVFDIAPEPTPSDTPTHTLDPTDPTATEGDR